MIQTIRIAIVSNPAGEWFAYGYVGMGDKELAESVRGELQDNAGAVVHLVNVPVQDNFIKIERSTS